MSTTFMRSARHFLTSESVTEGHPDKVCDQISDAVLDAILTDDKGARVACETAITTGLVMVMGEITTKTYVEIPKIVREVVRDIGYTDSAIGFDYETCGVAVSIKEQSPDIAGGVDIALEVRRQAESDRELDIGAGDQGMMVGFACDETAELMPLTISLAHRMAKQLADVRKRGALTYLRPDGKTQVTVEYEYGVPKRIDALVISTQHDPDVDNETLTTDLRHHVIAQVVQDHYIDADTKIYINPSGRFVEGGPKADAGLTGRKIIVDTYGGVARHGGGAFSGKDPTKVDRSAAYAARWVAKNVVAAGLARRCEFQLSYAIGKAHPTSVDIETFGTAAVDEDKIRDAIRETFDLRPGAIIRDLTLRRPIYRATAAYGHFGRLDIDAPWEKTDRADALARACGVTAPGAK